MSLFVSHKQKLKFFGIVLVMFAATNANATLVLSDFNSGDKKILQDTSSGLEWVRWNNTNSSGNVNFYLTEYSGFRLATASQVLGLFSDAGLPTSSQNSIAGSSSVGQSFATFQDLIGYGDLQSGANPVSYGTASDNRMYGFRHNMNNNTFDFFTQDSYTASNGSADTSWALVRETPTSVPEPASLALVGFGLAGLGLARRKYKKQ